MHARVKNVSSKLAVSDRLLWSARRSGRGIIHVKQVEVEWRGPMRTAVPAVLTLVFITHTAAAQTPLPPPAQAMDMRAAELQTMIKAYPGGNAEIKSIDAGKHVIDLWLEQRKAGLTSAPGTNGIAHAEITEIYYIVQGTAMLVTGGRLIDPRLNESLPKTEFPGGGRFPTPTYGGAFQGGVSRKIGPGDVIVMPPGTVHQWASVDSGQMLVYFIARIDPEHRQAAGALNAVLKTK
jgi:mannose-6-phosphate isomerase-like protein (cupin superfamily)